MAFNYYKNIVDTYDRQWKAYTDKTLGKASEYLPDLAGKSILDHGCGTGEFVWRMLVNNIGLTRIIGYDPSGEMLRQARNKIRPLPDDLRKKVEWQSEDQYDTQFDLIVSTSVLHYLPQPQKTLKHWRSLLRPEGSIILLDYSKNGWLPRYFEWAIRLVDQAHHRAYYLSQAEAMVERAGFRMESREVFTISSFWQGFIIQASIPN
jgi:SAM-dependent methyltransferase